MAKRGFDADKYIAVQSVEILKRVRKFGKLYLEVGGKLCLDEHAARVLPGYRKTSKVEILKGLGNLEIVYCVNAGDLESGREVGLSELSYEEKVLGDLKDMKKFEFDKIRIVVTRFDGENFARKFGERLRKMGYRVYFHGEIEGYGENLTATLRGYDGNDYVELKEDLIVVTGPGGGSGKMGFCLSQMYRERKTVESKKLAVGSAGFAKFESFPIWNLPMNHPVNLAYEAATADLGDYNVVDVFHKKAYRKRAVNYNRDAQNFEILLGLMRKVSGSRWPFGYRSPTDMGVNMMRVGIVDDGVCRRTGVAEVRRRLKGAKKGSLEWKRILKILKRVNI